MALSMGAGFCLRGLCRRKATARIFFRARRYLLSEAYACQESWNKRLAMPMFQSMGDVSDFAMSLRDNFERTGTLSAIDMDLLSNRLHDIPTSQLDYMEQLFQCFGRTQDVLKMPESTACAVVRAYIQHGQVGRLLDIIRDKITYRIFLEQHSANLLMDHLIKQNKIADAVRVCHEFTLQEDFSHPTTRLLSLYVTSAYLDTISLDPPEQTQQPDNEEEDWVPVSYINNPHFDFHFDLADEKMLLGKTLMSLSYHLTGQTALNCEVIGLAYFESFDASLEILEQLALPDSTKDERIHANVLDRMKLSLSVAATRNADAPEKEAGFLRDGDDRDLYHPTPQEKDAFLHRLESVAVELERKNLIDDSNMHEAIRGSVTAELAEREPIDIKEQTERFDAWVKLREEMVSAQLQEHHKTVKKAEIVAKLEELNEKEELLTYFAKKHDIQIMADRAPQEKVRMDPEVIRMKRIKRRKVRIMASSTL